jgi:hypothetical protein
MVFAVVLLFVVDFFNAIDGIAAIANCNIHRRRTLRDRRPARLGCVALILGAVQVFAAIGVLAGNQAVRWFAVAVIGLNAIRRMFSIPGYPVWALMIIAVDVVALWGLCLREPREPDRLAAATRRPAGVPVGRGPACRKPDDVSGRTIRWAQPPGGLGGTGQAGGLIL